MAATDQPVSGPSPPENSSIKKAEAVFNLLEYVFERAAKLVIFILFFALAVVKAYEVLWK